jgi:cell division protein FtsW
MTKSHSPDYFLMVIIGLLLAFGIVIRTSASAAVAYQKFNDSYYYLKRQFLLGILPGLVLLYIFSRIDYRRWKRFGPWLLALSILLLVGVFLPGFGYSYGRAHRWLKLGPIIFQPSEIVKLTFLLYLAVWLEKKGKKLNDFSYGFLPFVILLALIAGLIIAQPDIGTVGIVVFIALVVYFIAGARLYWLGVLVGGGVSVLLALIKIAPYRLARLVTFLHPNLDPMGIGYHVRQALVAIGSGGIFGLGLGHSRQKFLYLPEVISDSIFAVIAEEMGFIVTLGIIALFLFLVYRGFKIAAAAPDSFGRFLAIGITCWIVGQAIINMAAMLGLVPLTGLPLPFISYGGTSMVTTLIASGLLINISKNTIS